MRAMSAPSACPANMHLSKPRESTRSKASCACIVGLYGEKLRAGKRTERARRISVQAWRPGTAAGRGGAGNSPGRLGRPRARREAEAGPVERHHRAPRVVGELLSHVAEGKGACAKAVHQHDRRAA